jgi:hypothetical protein
VSQLERLSLLRRQLGGLLGLLEDPHAAPEALKSALHSCSLVFEALRAGDPSLAGVAPGERARLASAFEDTLRLNAVTLGRAEAAGEELALGISRAQQGLRHARALSSESVHGEACDLSA